MDLWSKYHKLKTKESDVFEDNVLNALPTLQDVGNMFRFMNAIAAFMDMKSRVFINYFDKFIIVS